MSRSLRYSSPELCEALAAQYVAGSMTPRVRRRMERLILERPPMARAVADWADRMQPLQRAFPDRAPPPDVWARIEGALDHNTRTSNPGRAARRPRFGWRAPWSHPGFLQATLAGMAALLAIVLVMPEPAGEPVGADYLAPMEWRDEVALVVTGYQDASGTSRLVTQWSSRLDERPEGELHLWAEMRGDGDLEYIGPLATDNQSWTVDPDVWRTIQYSSRLLVNTDPDTLQPQLALLSGPCIQLSHWDYQDSGGSPAAPQSGAPSSDW